jgi:hypothetical protein
MLIRSLIELILDCDFISAPFYLGLVLSEAFASSKYRVGTQPQPPEVE